MHPLKLYVLLAASLSTNATGARTSASDSRILESARARYYNLVAEGFHSLDCSVKFDFSTVPLISQSSGDPTRKLLEQTEFTLTLDDRGRSSVQHHYPNGSTADQQQGASQAAGLLTSLVGGLFQTWPSKGLQGPIPPFDSQVESVSATDAGHVVKLRVPGASVQVIMDKTYLVTEIVSVDGKLDEHPVYVSSPKGMIFTGNYAFDKSGQAGPVEVRYELGTSLIDGLRLPSSARLRVNQNIDVKFVLLGCTVKKETVVHVAAPQETP